MKNNQLWIEVLQGDDGIEAQFCDLKIAARGKDKQELLVKLADALIVSYEVSMELGETPFACLLNGTPSALEQLKRDAFNGEAFGSISLPHSVALALSTALHMIKPSDSISLKIAA